MTVHTHLDVFYEKYTLPPLFAATWVFVPPLFAATWVFVCGAIPSIFDATLHLSGCR